MKTTLARIIGPLSVVAVVACPAATRAGEAPAGAEPPTLVPAQRMDREQPVAAVRAVSSPPREITVWLAGGVGPASIGGEGAVLARTELAVGYGRQLFSLSYGYTEDTNGSCDAVICFGNDISLPRNSAKELALRYGVKGRAPYVLGTASVGVAALWGVQRGSALQSQTCFWGCVLEYDHTNFRTMGATAEIGGYFSSRFVSVGPTFIVDVNPVQSFWAVMFDLHIGFAGSP